MQGIIYENWFMYVCRKRPVHNTFWNTTTASAAAAPAASAGPALNTTAVTAAATTVSSTDQVAAAGKFDTGWADSAAECHRPSCTD